MRISMVVTMAAMFAVVVGAAAAPPHRASSDKGTVFALQRFEAYYGGVQLTKANPENCDLKTDGSKLNKYYAERFIAVDHPKGVAYTIALEQNNSQPAGPFAPYLVSLSLSDGEVQLQKPLTDLSPQYLGLESFGIDVASDGTVVIVSRTNDDPQNHHVFTYDVSSDTLTDLGGKVGGKNAILCSTLDVHQNILHVAYGNKIYAIDITDKAAPVTAFPNKQNLCTMDFNPSDGLIYGIGLNGYQERTLASLNATSGKSKDIGTIGQNLAIALDGLSTLDYDAGMLYAFLGTYSPIAEMYQLYAIDLSNGYAKSNCGSFPGSDCCEALAYHALSQP